MLLATNLNIIRMLLVTELKYCRVQTKYNTEIDFLPVARNIQIHKLAVKVEEMISFN